MDKRLRKKIIFARNHKIHLLMEHVRHHELNMAVQQAEAARIQKAVMSRAVISNDGEPVWSAKTQEIRDKLTGKKRMAKDRWNRFAGTSGGGGRGR